MKILKILCLALLFAATALSTQPAFAQSMDTLASDLTKNLRGKGYKIAVAGFEHPGGAEFQKLADLLSERLTTSLVKTRGIDVMERRLLKRLLNEQGLKLEGIIAGDNSEEVGKLLKVDYLVIGALYPSSPRKAELNVRVVHTVTGEIQNAAAYTVQFNSKQDGIETITAQETTAENAESIQIALLLDTSNSMDGLINQAKTQLWKIINMLATAERNGKNPDIEIALYEYGNDSLNVARGYIRQVLPFTTDMDLLSKELFGLTTNGGSEYAGFVINEAVDKLKWRDGKETYKAIFIAGNEPFDQGPIKYSQSISRGLQKEIYINTIFCGAPSSADALGWKRAAKMGRGMFLNIDQNQEYVAIKTPYDERIQELGSEINSTYVPYGGKAAEENLAEQEAQDSNAMSNSASGAPVERSVYKAQRQYSKAAHWDIVSLVENGSLKIDEIKPEHLPDHLKKLTPEELEKYINDQIQKRKAIRDEINELNKKRRGYIDTERKKKSEQSDDLLDVQMEKALKEQAAEKDYEFK